MLALVATAASVAWSRANSGPQPYGGEATANDVLSQVVADPSGGVWATGIRFDRNPSQQGATPVADFILHHTQGGWVISKQFDMTGQRYIVSLAMVSATEGWAVGRVGGGSGLILHYQNGSWTEQSYHPPALLSAITLVSPTEGWIVGGRPDNGETMILHLQNGQWTPVQAPAVGVLHTIAMTSPSDGWAVGQANDAPTLAHYTDGVWATAAFPATAVPPDASPPDQILALTSPAPDALWGVGSNGTIVRYSNGAWTSVTSPATNAMYSSVSMTSASDGWAVGQNSQTLTGVILRSVGGVWTVAHSPTRQPLLSVVMLSPSEGWAVGEQGTILHYSGGAWSIVNGG